MSIRPLTTPPLRGRVTVPGDKSISHRALLLAALGDGPSRIQGLNPGVDVTRSAAAVAALGATVEASASGLVQVEGCGGAAAMAEPDEIVDAGNSGTTLRCLLGIAAGVPGTVVVTGDESLRRRPMLRVVAPLRQMGARIDGRRHGDRAPLVVRGGALTGIDHRPDVASAQVKTAVLLAGLTAAGTTSVTEPRKSRDHTERMLQAAGVTVATTATSATISGPAVVQARDWDVPGDLSSAMFLIVAATLVPGSDLVVTDVGLNPTRTAALDVLTGMGAQITIEAPTELDGEPRGEVHVRHAPLSGVTVPAELAPALIDEVPALAVAASQAEGETAFEGVGELRVKESDRIDSLTKGLRALGGKAEGERDRLVVTGGAPLDGGRVESYDDHRIALAFAVAGLVAKDKVTVTGWKCVDVSWPGFLDTLGRAQQRVG